MVNSFSRSWEIAKASFSTMNKDKEILLFPIIAGFASFIVLLSFIVPFLIGDLIAYFVNDSIGQIFGLVVLFFYYLITVFIATFANVGVVYIALNRFSGKNPTFAGAFKFAMSRVVFIFQWSVLAAIVGVILRIIENAARNNKNPLAAMTLMITRGLLGAAWAIATIFVIPILAYENVSPFQAIKRSLQTFKQTWGETAIGYLGFGIVQFIVVLVSLVISVLVGLVLFLLNPVVGIIGGILVAVLLFSLVALVFSVATTVYRAALYVYAKTGKLPGDFAAIDAKSLVRHK